MELLEEVQSLIHRNEFGRVTHILEEELQRGSNNCRLLELIVPECLKQGYIDESKRLISLFFNAPSKSTK